MRRRSPARRSPARRSPARRSPERKFDTYSEWLVKNKEVFALWDTGANKSCISNKLIQELLKTNPNLKVERLQIGLRGNWKTY